MLEENMRQICIWEYSDALWWDYSIKWNENCFLTDNPSDTFNKNCSFTQLNALDENAWEDVGKCVNISGGAAYEGGTNFYFEEALRLVQISFLVCTFLRNIKSNPWSDYHG